MNGCVRFLLFSLLVATSSIAHAAPGDLDTSFGSKGYAVYDGGGNSWGHAVDLQQDGRIIVAGSCHNGTDDDLVVLRYNTDGTLDTGFGTDGVATYGSGNDAGGYAVVLQQDSRIIVAGYRHSGTDDDLVVLRYNTDGTLDTGFGTDGVATYDSGNDARGLAVALQQNGRIIVAGYRHNGTDDNLVVLRYNTDGTLDTGFGTDGVATYDSGNDARGLSVALQQNGRIIVAGYRHNGTDDDLVVLGYNTDGTLDTGFGTDGVATYDSGNDNRGEDVVLQDDGRIIVAGSVYNHPRVSHYDLVILRYNADGILDVGFGTDGVATYDNGSWDQGYAIALQPNGRIIAAGISYSYNMVDSDLVVLRFNIDGTLDTHFGTSGVATQGFSDSASGSAVALQPDGGIVATGGMDYYSYSNILTVRIVGGAFPVNHSVTFQAGTGGSITGELVQVVTDGADCTPVTAVVDPGNEFSGWSGDYSGTDNPLTIATVSDDMNITANFTTNGGGGNDSGCFISLFGK